MRTDIGNGITIFLPTSRPYGLPYSEWTTRWWQWIASIPKDINPGYDRTGTYSDSNQTMPIWYLAGTFDVFSYVERRCTVPVNMGIMFPVIACEKSFAEYPDAQTEDGLAKMAIETNEHVKNTYAEIDDTIIPICRVRSFAFDLSLPKNNIFGVEPGITRSVSEGYWIIIGPLPRGTHDLKFGGEAYVDGTLEFETHTLYYLNVN